MNNKEEKAPVVAVKRKRGRPSHKDSSTFIASEQASAYGISLPQLAEPNERYLSPDDIGSILNITPEAVKQWIYRRKLPAVKLANGYWKVRVRDFEGFLRARSEIGSRHVLVTDGGHGDIKPITDAIEAAGFRAVVAMNYSDALLKALDHLPSMFIVCISPNDPDCWKFAERVKAQKALRSFPILFLGGKTISDEETDKAVACNAQGILTRPIAGETLQNEIKRIIQRAS
ncbi:MAG: helix-turn-helix domain-containing protein [Planctomycetota bacterium]